jgi:hypothetical protein
MRMAENIKASGLPPKAYSEIKIPLVKAILEAGSMEDDPGMQERWANLLANVLTVTGTLPVALARILADLEPVEAATLDRISTNENADGTQVVDLSKCRSWFGIKAAGLDNLTRLELLRYNLVTPKTINDFETDNADAKIRGVAITDLGGLLVAACRPPVVARAASP